MIHRIIAVFFAIVMISAMMSCGTTSAMEEPLPLDEEQTCNDEAYAAENGQDDDMHAQGMDEEQHTHDGDTIAGAPENSPADGPEENHPEGDPDIELVVNGGFEDIISDAPEQWDVIPADLAGLGWNVEWNTPRAHFKGHDRPATALLEIQFGVNGWLPAEGDHYVELDTDWNGPGGKPNGEPASVAISQDIPTIPGRTYSLMFAFSPRPGTKKNNNRLEVSIEGACIDVLRAPGETATVWTEHEYLFVAEGDYTEIGFADIGTADSLGTFLDDVSVRYVE